jgi:hypothetical protein
MNKSLSQGALIKHYLLNKEIDLDELWRLLGYTSYQTLDFHLQREKLSPHFIDDLQQVLKINVADILSHPPLHLQEDIEEEDLEDIDEPEKGKPDTERIITRTETVIPIFLGRNRLAKIVLPEDYS